MSKPHSERAHSKFSASGAERWFNCPGSVELSEGMPDKPSPWSIEGTLAHSVLEKIMRIDLADGAEAEIQEFMYLIKTIPEVQRREMEPHAEAAARFILNLGRKLNAEVMVETRIYLDFIHPEMFGTFDGAVLDHFGTLHVFDFKYGAGHSVSPKENLQMIFYAIGLAHKYDWNFKRVRVWIIQPRIKGYDGPAFWEISTLELKSYVWEFKKAVDRVKKFPDKYVDGSWCHWCKAKSVCPLKLEAKNGKAVEIFSIKKKGSNENEGKKSKSPDQKSEAGWKKEATKKNKSSKGKDRKTKGQIFKTEDQRHAESFAESLRIEEEIDYERDFY